MAKEEDRVLVPALLRDDREPPIGLEGPERVRPPSDRRGPGPGALKRVRHVQDIPVDETRSSELEVDRLEVGENKGVE